MLENIKKEGNGYEVLAMGEIGEELTSLYDEYCHPGSPKTIKLAKV
jgi:hypothetical protein